MEYAEGDTLHDYLEENFSLLTWQDKHGLALQLSSAVKYLHEKFWSGFDLRYHRSNARNVRFVRKSIHMAIQIQ